MVGKEMTAIGFLPRSKMALLALGLVFLNGFLLAKPVLFQPVPYKGVYVALAEVQDGRFNLVADFTTTDCRFQQLEVVGFGLGGWSPPLMWRDEDGLGQNHIRLEGDHTLRISANLAGLIFDAIEVRTRHLCEFDVDENGDYVGGVYVDRVFMRYET